MSLAPFFHVDESSDLEPERYELHQEEPFYRFDLNRRDFCRTMGGGLLVMLMLPAVEAQAQESGQSGRPGHNVKDTQVGAWLRIDEQGKVHGFTGKVEVGQGTRTMLAQVVADELQIPVEQISMTMGDTSLCPYDRGTFGSLSTPNMAPQLRRAAAATRDALLEMAAEQWSTSPDQLDLRDGNVVEKGRGKRSISLGDLTRGKELTRRILPDQPVKTREDWTVAGKPVKNVNSMDLVTGAHKYPGDMRLENMLYGAILRPPQFDAELKSVNTSAAEKMPGIVVARDNGFVGVAAPTSAQARKALASIEAEWSKPPNPPDDRTVYDWLKANPSEPRSGGGWGGSASNREGDVAAGLDKATKKLEAKFSLPYIAHVPLETRAAVAEWKDGKLTVWTGTQRPFGVRQELSRAFSIPEENVRVLMPDTGSGYGGKHTAEVALEAARLAKAAKRPVKVVWTREEEFTWAYFRPAGLMELRGGIDAEGNIVAWEHINWNSGASGIRMPYKVPSSETRFQSTKTPLRQGSYRALAAVGNNFARESFMDELAAEAGIDPLEFRLKHLEDERMRAVLEAVAKEIGWKGREKEAGHGFGLACGAEKGGYVATAVQLEAGEEPSQTRLRRIVCAFECGAIINPDSTHNQVEGGVIQALGGAMSESIHFADGKIQNPALDDYDVPRFRDLPEIKVLLLDRKDLPSAGAGETPLIALAPAIGNAIAEATGRRQRSLPLGRS